MHQEVHQFYARQMWLLDNGEAARWAATFTEDGVFAESGKGDPLVGRGVIELAAARRADALAADGVARRHWLDMLAVDDHGDGTATARYSALSILVPRGEQPRIFAGTRAQDLLVRVNGGFEVRHRVVSHDGRDKVAATQEAPA
ncbi:nuclear transport factor 2 family protein [Actinokineospora sp. G85]|uniref:nuclear transport factor 2 family protein n=1 Tax=Actinokineospora sp. G85 TaxID=3406626 RepID=UPI003C713B9D